MTETAKCIMLLGKTTVHLTVFHSVINDICGKRAVNVKNGTIGLANVPFFLSVPPCVNIKVVRPVMDGFMGRFSKTCGSHTWYYKCLHKTTASMQSRTLLLPQLC